jgi:hypothetical protein
MAGETIIEQGHTLHTALACRIMVCSERGIRLLRLRVTRREWLLLQAVYRAEGGQEEAVPMTFMGYPLAINEPRIDPHAANRRMERMFPNWNDRPRNVRGAPV